MNFLLVFTIFLFFALFLVLQILFCIFCVFFLLLFFCYLLVRALICVSFFKNFCTFFCIKKCKWQFGVFLHLFAKIKIIFFTKQSQRFAHKKTRLFASFSFLSKKMSPAIFRTQTQIFLIFSNVVPNIQNKFSSFVGF